MLGARSGMIVGTAIGLLLFSATFAWCQAAVDENKETSNLYVDVVHGSDSNAGTQQKPFQTLNKGVQTAATQSKKGIGTRVTVLPGTYREAIIVAGSSTAPVTVEAATAGTVTVSGADVWTGWAAYSGNSNIYTHAWPYKWGYCAQLPGPTEQEIVRRQEQIFVNGFHLTQVLSLKEMATGTFFVNETNATAYIWPPSQTTMSNATVEVSTRPTVFELEGLNDWVLRGITFQYTTGCRNTQSAVFVTEKASNILFDTDKFLWNNSTGLDFGDVTDVTVQSSEGNHNGQDGMYAQYVENGLWTADEGSYNNWRGAQGAYYAFNVAGMKFGEVHNTTINSFQALFNQSHGLHLDTDIRNVTLESFVSLNNLNGGIQLEADPGPVTLSAAKICNNNRMLGTYSGGVNITDSANVTITGSTLYNNGTSQFMVWGRNGGIAVTDYQTNATSQVSNEHFSFDSNTIEATASQELFEDSYLSSNWSELSSTLGSDYNTWWSSSNAASYIVPVPVGHTAKTFSGWQSLTKQDLHSTFSSPGVSPTTSCEATPDSSDYQFIVNSGSNTVNKGAKSSYVFTAFSLAFTGTISLKADVSAIPGATASWSAASIESSGTSTLTVATSSSTQPGTYPVTVIANSGNLTHTVTVSLVVN